jgi:hypothetical protein
MSCSTKDDDDDDPGICWVGLRKTIKKKKNLKTYKMNSPQPN